MIHIKSCLFMHRTYTWLRMHGADIPRHCCIKHFKFFGHSTWQKGKHSLVLWSPLGSCWGSTLLAPLAMKSNPFYLLIWLCNVRYIHTFSHSEARIILHQAASPCGEQSFCEGNNSQMWILNPVLADAKHGTFGLTCSSKVSAFLTSRQCQTAVSLL